MNKILLFFALAFSGLAFADDLIVTATGAKCSAVQTGDGDNQHTTNECATKADLPSLKWHLDEGWSVLADFKSGSLGASIDVAPGLNLGLKGAVSNTKSSGKEKHASSATLFAELNKGLTQTTLSAIRTQSADKTPDNNGASLAGKLFLRAGQVQPFVGYEVAYSQAKGADDQVLAGSLSLGIRIKTPIK